MGKEILLKLNWRNIYQLDERLVILFFDIILSQFSFILNHPLKSQNTAMFMIILIIFFIRGFRIVTNLITWPFHFAFYFATERENITWSKTDNIAQLLWKLLRVRSNVIDMAESQLVFACFFAVSKLLLQSYMAKVLKLNEPICAPRMFIKLSVSKVKSKVKLYGEM